MALELEIVGEDAVSEASDLRKWIERERIRDIEEVEQRVIAPKPGEQGPTALAILKIVLSSAALVKLAESVHVWIKSSRKKIKIKISDGDRVIEVEADNPGDLQELVDAAKKLQVG